LANQIHIQAGDILRIGEGLLAAYDKDPKINGVFDFQANADAVRQLDTAAAAVRQLSVDLATYEISLQDAAIQRGVAQGRLMKDNIITLMIIVFLSANLIAFLLSIGILKPIDKLMAATRKVARGEMKVSTGIKTKDEIGTLAASFDKMAQEVDARRDELEMVYGEEKKQRLELEEEAKARAQFINVLAHEMRTPLTPLLISLDSIKATLAAKPESVQQQLIDAARTSAASLKTRLEELLDLAMFTRGTFSLNFQTLDTGEMLRRIGAVYQPVLEKKKQRLIVNLEPDLPAVEVDLSRLEQVLLNLLSNASKYAPEDTDITLKAKREKGQLQVEIIDQGIGISEEDQKKLFKPYHQVEQDRQKFPGIGLGLAVSKQIIDAHHGKIWVESEPGKGCKFKFTLPLQQPDIEAGGKAKIKTGYDG
jgi:signal transduction histidine kinase